MRIALCNEVIADMAFDEQCRFAAALGYDGLEVAPFTLGGEPHRLPPETVRATRQAAEDAGIAITGLHWLLVRPDGLSITTDDDAAFASTVDVGLRLVELCAELGGSVLVHGSPKQRMLPDDDGRKRARDRAIDYLRPGRPRGRSRRCRLLRRAAGRRRDQLREHRRRRRRPDR